LQYDEPVSFVDPDDDVESTAIPGYRNYLVYCDDSGLHGSPNAFGTI
jgi:hypothetical protein